MTPFASSRTNSKPRLPFFSHVFPTFLILCPKRTQYWLLSDEGKGTNSLLDSQALQILFKGLVVFFEA